MARTAARNAKIYIDISSAANGSATPVSFTNSWSIDQARDFIDVTSFGDANKTSVAGLADSKGQIEGFLNMGTATFSYLTDGVARKLYLYPDATDNSGVYWWGTARFSGSYSGSVSDAIKVSMSWAAASDIALVGSL